MDDERLRRIAMFDQCDAAVRDGMPKAIASIAVLQDEDIEPFWARLVNETDIEFVNAIRPQFTALAAELKQHAIECLGVEAGMAFLEKMASGELKTGESDDE